MATLGDVFQELNNLLAEGLVQNVDQARLTDLLKSHGINRLLELQQQDP